MANNRENLERAKRLKSEIRASANLKGKIEFGTKLASNENITVRAGSGASIDSIMKAYPNVLSSEREYQTVKSANLDRSNTFTLSRDKVNA